MSYNRFQYWVRGPRHRKLSKAYPIEKRIENGDFEYPSDVLKDMNNQKKDLEKRMKEFRTQALKKGQGEESIREGLTTVFKKARVSLQKVHEELITEEETRLEEFKQAAFTALYPYLDIKIKQAIWDNILERTFNDSELNNKLSNTLEFYNEYKNQVVEYKTTVA